MLRPGQEALLTRLRTMIGDEGDAGPTPTATVLSDARLADWLDAHRTDVRYMELAYGDTWLPTGLVVLDYYAPYPDWDEDVQLVSSTFHTLTPASSDLVAGHWTFATNQWPPVYLVGSCYDLYGAAADALEAWAATVKLDYLLRTETGATHNRPDKHRQLLEQAARYRTRARPRTAILARTDVVPEGGGRRWP